MQPTGILGHLAVRRHPSFTPHGDGLTTFGIFDNDNVPGPILSVHCGYEELLMLETLHVGLTGKQKLVLSFLSGVHAKR